MIKIREKHRFSFYLKDDSSPDISKAKMGVAPNFIHNLDVMILICFLIKFFFKEEKSSIATIHDSVATHANHVKLVKDLFKEVFVENFEKNTILLDLLKINKIDEESLLNLVKKDPLDAKFNRFLMSFCRDVKEFFENMEKMNKEPLNFSLVKLNDYFLGF